MKNNHYSYNIKYCGYLTNKEGCLIFVFLGQGDDGRFYWQRKDGWVIDEEGNIFEPE